MDEPEPLVDVAFIATAIAWRGPAPHVFLPVPAEHVPALRDAARRASYGWGVIPVVAELGGLRFATSLFPRDGGYLLPLKLAIRRAANIVPGDSASVRLQVFAPAVKDRADRDW